jgi:hypothetical protein
MKIYEFSPFFNENLIAEIKIEEAKNWINELHISESDRTFRYAPKEYYFSFHNEPIVKYHKLNGRKIYRSPKGFDTIINKLTSYFSKNFYSRIVNHSYVWYNESVQRNFSYQTMLPFKDDDIIIFSDIDEIIDSRYASTIVREVQKRGVLSIKLHFSMFFLNLFSKNWGGAPDYSYRTFIMTGKYLNELTISIDELRKNGEHGNLIDTIYCPTEFMGFHHSWLGDYNFVMKKLQAYCHSPEDHAGDFYDKENKTYSQEAIKKALLDKKSLFPGHELEVDTTIPLLQSVEKRRSGELSRYFI